MKNKKGLLILIALLVLLIAGSAVLYNTLSDEFADGRLPGEENSSGEDGSGKEDSKAPDFTVYDVDGNAVKLSDYFGKPIVLNFWASWCGPCKTEMPEFNAAYLEQGDEIHFLMVNMTTSQRESFESAKSYVEGEGFSFPVFYDTKSNAANTYGVYSLPTTIFIDKDGNMVTYAMGAIDAELLEKGIGMIK